ncbi:MAG: hypothetical protein MJZ34_07280 [Paludibacteraceae bacterium]|nr:hypothetical protein [Paludibacteraceae bacterium]
MNEFITRLLEDGLTIEISMKDGNLVYDLKTMMKSECIVTDKGNGILNLSGRYDWNVDYDTNDDDYKGFIEYIARNCSCGRSYCSCSWSDLLAKYDIVI